MKSIYTRLIAICFVLALFSMALAPASLAREKRTDDRIERSAQTVQKTNEASVPVSEAKTDKVESAVVESTASSGVEILASEEPAWLGPQVGSAIPWSCFASGGGTCSSPSYQLAGTVGQTAICPVSSTSFNNMQGFWQYFETTIEHCCTGLSVSDVNCSGGIDITDIQVMIDHLYLTLQPLCCEEEGNINYPGTRLPGESDVIDIVDLQWMVDNQFLSLEPLPPCP